MIMMMMAMMIIIIIIMMADEGEGTADDDHMASRLIFMGYNLLAMAIWLYGYMAMAMAMVSLYNLAVIEVNQVGRHVTHVNYTDIAAV